MSDIHFTEPDAPPTTTPEFDRRSLWRTVWQIENEAGVAFGLFSELPLDDMSREQRALHRILMLAGRAMTDFPPQWPAKEDPSA